MDPLETNKRLARDFLAALSRWDSDALLALTHPDFDLHLPSDCGLPRHSSRDAIKPILAIFSKVAPGGIRFHIRHLTAEDDRVCVAADGESSLHDGSSYNNRYHILFRIEDGKIIEYVEFMDSHLVATRLLPAFEACGFVAS